MAGVDWDRAAIAAALPDGSGCRASSMNERHAALLPDVQRDYVRKAAERILEWEKASSGNREMEAAIAQQASERPGVHLVAQVFDAEQCKRIWVAVRQAADRRGGWDYGRHAKYPTVDMPLAEVAADVEDLVRTTVYAKILRPLAATFFGSTVLPEHLCYNDLFFVRYRVAQPGGDDDDGSGAASEPSQSSLQMHTDGSIFSFNVVLSTPDVDFGGGGTVFEHDGVVARPVLGGAVAHGGQVRHGGVAITWGERLLLVGFVAAEPSAKSYSSKLARWAAYHAYVKFGDAAWQRDGA
jgi:hypothetical protein